MRRVFLGSCALVLFGMLYTAVPSQGQQLLKAKGWGSLSGKVTLKGARPVPDDLTPKMQLHADKACCLAGKPSEKIDLTWVVDPTTNGIANVVIWLKPPPGTFFETHDKFKVRKEAIVFDQPHCAFLPHVAAFHPVNKTAAGDVPTGQSMLIKNSATVSHNVRAVGDPNSNPGFNTNLPAGAELDVTKKLVPQLMPISLQCDVHPWMNAKLFVFDHPYFAITKEDGTYEIPFVPAGSQIKLMAWHEGVGWAIPERKAGRAISITADTKTTFDIELTP